MTARRSLILALLALPALALQGCFVFLPQPGDDDDGGGTVVVQANEPPYVLDGGDDTWWQCSFSDTQGDYFWEFQATVDDLDGLDDVAWVDVIVYPQGDDVSLDDFGLLDEGAGVWGGLVWEADSALRCGDPVDVLFEVGDRAGDVGDLWVSYR